MQQLRLACPLSAWTGEPGRCQWCNKEMPQGRRTVYCSDRCRRAFEREHFWPRARATARRRGGRSCINGCEGRIEVNHIEPLVGAGYGPSCYHHQSNLELLCTTCHREVTLQQRSQRKAAVLAQESPPGAAGAGAAPRARARRAPGVSESVTPNNNSDMTQRKKGEDCPIVSGEVDPRSYDELDREWATLGLSAPARRAMVNAGWLTLADLTAISEQRLLAQHGFGPSSLPKLRAALAAAGLSFATHPAFDPSDR